MPAALVTPREFVCPGEHYAISRAVHLARMASGYAACRDCACQTQAHASRSSHDGIEAGSITKGVVPQRSRRQRLMVTEGIRGTYRNELSLLDAEAFATALATLIWSDAEATGSGVPARGFPVVVGHDERPWSMSIAVAAGAALRLAGCETIDVGFVTGPAFRFAVSHLGAVAGLLATGAGSGPAVAGLDFVGVAGRPMSAGGSLDRLCTAPLGRLTRRGGGRREFDANLPYEASLRRHFQDVAAASVVVGTASPLLHERLVRIGREIPTAVDALLLPREADQANGPSPRAIAQITNGLTESKACLGVWIDEGGSGARVFDSRGRVLPVERVAAELIGDALNDRPRGTIAVDWLLADRLGETALRGQEVARSGGTAEAMAITVADHAAIIGVDSRGRMWLPGPPVACDALVMLARILKAFGAKQGRPCRPCSA